MSVKDVLELGQFGTSNATWRVDVLFFSPQLDNGAVTPCILMVENSY
jgi:hypothetical protein